MKKLSLEDFEPLGALPVSKNVRIQKHAQKVFLHSFAQTLKEIDVF